MATTKKPARPKWLPPESFHRAFVTVPKGKVPERDEDDRKALRHLAKRRGISKRWALCAASWGEWFLERQANRARAWAAKYHPGAPLDLEGFASYVADNRCSNLPRDLGLATGRSMWFRSLACIEHWEAERISVAWRFANQIEYEKRDAKIDREFAARRRRAA